MTRYERITVAWIVWAIALAFVLGALIGATGQRARCAGVPADHRLAEAC